MGGKISVFGRKNRLHFRFRPEKTFGFQRKPLFFGDHLFLAGKTAYIFDLGQKKPSDFGEDLSFWRSSVFGRKNCLNFRLRPEIAFGFRRRPVLFFVFF